MQKYFKNKKLFFPRYKISRKGKNAFYFAAENFVGFDDCGIVRIDYLRTQSVTSLKGWPMCLVLFMSWSSR